METKRKNRTNDIGDKILYPVKIKNMVKNENKIKLLVTSKARYRTNGISSVIRNFYLNDSFKDWDISFFFPVGSDEFMVTELQSFGYHVYVCPFKNPLKQYFELKRLIKKERFDAIHINGSSATVYLEIHAAHKNKCKKIIVHSHNSQCKHLIIHKMLKNSVNRELTDAVACSEFAGDWLFNRPYTIIPNGIDVKRFLFNKQIREQYRKDLNISDSFVIGHVANMNPEKNHLYLLDVFAQLLKIRSDAKLMLIGDGILKKEIDQKLIDLKIQNNVLLLGKRTDVANLYQAMDVFVLPSVFEGLPVTLIESQASGLHCVISNRVSKQVDITGNCSFLPIGQENLQSWVMVISTVSQAKNRLKWGEMVTNSGFNINNSVQYLKMILLN